MKHSPIPRRALVLLLSLAWSSLAFCAEIHDAARDGDLDKVKALVKANPDLALSEDNSGLTPLHLAAMWGQKDVAEVLLANKADINARNKKGETPLHWAEYEEQKDMADFLRQHGGHE